MASDSTESKDEGRNIPAALGTAVLLFGFIVQFFSVRQNIPFEIQIVSALFVAAAGFLFVVWVWYPPIARYQAKKKWKTKEDRISRESLPTFESYVERLKIMCSIQRMDALVFPLQSLKGQAEFTKLPDLYPWLYYVESLCSQLLGLFKRVDVNGETFPWAVDSFTFSLRLFSDSVNRFVNEARQMGEQKPIPKPTKEEYNTNRQTYLRFLEDYTAFVDKLNKQFRSYEKSYSPAVGGTYTVTAFQPVYAEKPKEL